MNREEYMKELSFLLQDISEDEKKEALEYYEDYFDEAGCENEESVIKELGSPEKVAAMIRDSLKGNTGQAEYTEQGYYNERYDEHQKMPDEFEKKQEGKGFAFRGDRNRNLALLIIIGVLLCATVLPVIVKAVFGIGGGILGLLGGILGIFLATGGGCLGLIGGGIGLTIGGIIRLFYAVPTGLLMMGAGLILIALGICLLMLCVWFIVKVVPRIINGIVNVFQRLFHKGV